MPQNTIQRLIDGFRSFRDTYYTQNRALFDALVAGGQSPKVMLIGCADSRVDPLLITNAEPGDLFIVRNVANLVPPYQPDGHYHGTSAALEFAVRTLGVAHIVVLGHAQCGGVRALLDGPPAGEGTDDFVSAWMQIAAEARERARALLLTDEGRRRACEFETVKLSLANLMTFPWIRDAVGRGRLTLYGWYFDLERGRLQQLDHATQEFTDV